MANGNGVKKTFPYSLLKVNLLSQNGACFIFFVLIMTRTVRCFFLCVFYFGLLSNIKKTVTLVFIPDSMKPRRLFAAVARRIVCLYLTE